MWEDSLTIRNPYGISVFGSALLKVSPDSAMISVAVTRLETRPEESFSKAREGARSVTQFLSKSGADEFGTSRISLSQQNRFVGGESRFLGYKANVGFTIVLKALDRLEEIVSGVIEAGANEIASIQFRTSNLKELRAQARRLAVEAAKEKAVLYSQAAGVRLGSIIHIQDVNPQILQKNRLGHFQARGQEQMQEDLVDHDAGKQTLDPGAIEVAAAVLVAFSLEKQSG
jgi:uncharacterized protein